MSDLAIEEMDSHFARERVFVSLRLLWGERRFLVRVVLAGLVMSALLALLIPRQYESTAQLMPPDSQSASNLAMLASLSSTGGLGMLAGDLMGVKSNGALFVGVLRSRTVADRLVDRFDLKKVYGKKLQIRAREKLASRTGIGEDRKSGIITVTVSDNERWRAAALASAYVDELNTLIAQVSTSSARRERIFLEDRLTAVKLDLEAAEKDFSKFASSKGAIDIPQQGKAMVEAAATLEGQLIAAQSEVEGLRQVYSDQNVRVRSAQARVNELRQQLRKLGGTATDSTQGETATLSDTNFPALRQLPLLGVPYADKLRRMKVQEVVFETLTKQYELAKVQEAKEVPAVKLLDAPAIPELRSFPPRTLITLIGTVLAVIGGVVWIVGAASWRELDSQDPGKLFATEVFHAIAAKFPWTASNGNGMAVPAAEASAQEDAELVAKSASAGK